MADLFSARILHRELLVVLRDGPDVAGPALRPVKSQPIEVAAAQLAGDQSAALARWRKVISGLPPTQMPWIEDSKAADGYVLTFRPATLGQALQSSSGRYATIPPYLLLGLFALVMPTYTGVG